MKSLFRLSLLSMILCSLLFVTNAISQTNLLPNGDLEIAEPNFWMKLHDGEGGSAMMWDMENAHNGMRSLKATKTSASSDITGWKTVNNANLYWNSAIDNANYTIGFWAKTEGVNTSPANDDAKIGALFAFYSGGSSIGESFLEIDQTAAATDWTEYTGVITLPAGNIPDEIYVTLYFGKDATGTVWFDDVNCGSEPWSMGIFNSDMEIPVGWLEWHATDEAGKALGFSNTVKGNAHSGSWSALLHEWDEDGDEMVFYSEPVPAEPNTWYKISVRANWDSVNTDPAFLPTNAIPDYVENRLGMCFFFHKGNIKQSWETTGGDQFFYFNQVEDTSTVWPEYTVIAKSTNDATGVSCRARFNSKSVGKVWYDDFSIEPIEVVTTGISNPGNYIRAEIPNEFKLGQNYPNPFNPETNIKYSVPNDGNIQIEVYNILGKKVRTLFEGQQTAGTYQVRWDARDDYGSTLSSGVYLITLRSGNFVTAKRVTLLK